MIRRKTDLFETAAAARRRPIRRGVVFYESFNGNGMLCHPEAIFRHLQTADNAHRYTHVWALGEGSAHDAVAAQFAGEPYVSFVRHGSAEYYRALATAEFLVNNTTFPPAFAKRPEQTYLNTWHGTPLKTMGYDMPGGGLESANVVRNFLSADYLLSSGEWMTETMYARAYRLEGIYTGRVLEAGSPRVDATLGTLPVPDRVRSQLPERRDDVTTVLLAPTWRGSEFAKPLSDARRLRKMAAGLTSRLGPGFRVLAKAHQRVYASSAGDPRLKQFLVPNDAPTNDLLRLVDVLVTDFSSIAYDFLPTGRPIIYFSDDPESYRDTRGYYFDPASWPGPLVRSLDGAAAVIRAVGSAGPDDPAVTHAEPYRSTTQRVALHDDGSATQRLVDTVFKGHDSVVSRTLPRSKPAVLIYLGDMRPNGITSSGMNLVANLDHDSVDVTVSYLGTTDAQRKQLIRRLDPRVRQVPRLGGHHPGVGRRRRASRFDRLYELGSGRLDSNGRNPALTDEWQRCFGEASFDRVVDLSGYGPFFARLLLQGSEPGQRSIWLHNDMVADSQRTTDGTQHLRTRLGQVFEHYRYFDHLVSVSEPLCRVNREKLSAYAAAPAFAFASNTIDARRIREMASEDDITSVTIPAGRDLIGLSLRRAIESLGDIYSPEAVLEEARLAVRLGRVEVEDGKGKVFVTAGRLSPEKNHGRLLRAFSLVHDEDPDVRLVILGDGPLMPTLKAEARALGLDLRTHVRFVGHLPNPFAAMARADCFVLSSDYEGQPMVILEARVLGLPVVSTSFSSVRGVLDDSTGLITDRTEEALADGMRAFLAGDVPSAPFDADAYNANAVAEFAAAIDLPSARPHRPAEV